MTSLASTDAAALVIRFNLSLFNSMEPTTRHLLSRVSWVSHNQLPRVKREVKSLIGRRHNGHAKPLLVIPLQLEKEKLYVHLHYGFFAEEYCPLWESVGCKLTTAQTSAKPPGFLALALYSTPKAWMSVPTILWLPDVPAANSFMDEQKDKSTSALICILGLEGRMHVYYLGHKERKQHVNEIHAHPKCPFGSSYVPPIVLHQAAG